MADPITTGRQIYDYFIARGLSPHQAAAIAGNMAHESGGNPGAVNIGDNTRQSPYAPHSFGLSQWNGPRLTGLVDYARQQGTRIPQGDLRDPAYVRGLGQYLPLQTQLGYAWNEMQGPEADAYRRITGAPDLSTAVAGAVGYHRPQGYSADRPEMSLGYSGRLSLADQIMRARSQPDAPLSASGVPIVAAAQMMAPPPPRREVSMPPIFSGVPGFADGGRPMPQQDFDALTNSLPPAPPQRPFPENLAHMPRGELFGRAHEWVTRNVLEPIQYAGMYPTRVFSRAYPDWPVPAEEAPGRIGIRRRMGEGGPFGGPIPINEIDKMGTYVPGGRMSDNIEDRRPRSIWEYKDGGRVVHGLDINIEHRKGSVRSGTSKDGHRWSVSMPCAYGDIKRTKAADGERVDCYIGSDRSDKVFVVDQVDAKTGKYDEAKVLMNFASKRDALAAYEKAFSDGKGRDRIGSVSEMSVDGFRDWLKSGNTKKPVGDLRRNYADGGMIPKPPKSLADNIVFLGENAETADHEALARAREAWARREDPETVRRQTGWFYHAGRPWFEADDRGFRQTRPLPPPSAGDRPFFDYFEHPEVLRAHPDLRTNLMLNTNPRGFSSQDNLAEYVMGGEGGGEEGGDNTRRIRLRERNFPSTTGPLGNITTPLHELDHALADRGGFLTVPSNLREKFGNDIRDNPAEQMAYETERRRALTPEQRLATPFQGFAPGRPPQPMFARGGTPMTKRYADGGPPTSNGAWEQLGDERYQVAPVPPLPIDPLALLGMRFGFRGAPSLARGPWTPPEPRPNVVRQAKQPGDDSIGQNIYEALLGRTRRPGESVASPGSGWWMVGGQPIPKPSNPLPWAVAGGVGYLAGRAGYNAVDSLLGASEERPPFDQAKADAEHEALTRRLEEGWRDYRLGRQYGTRGFFETPRPGNPIYAGAAQNVTVLPDQPYAAGGRVGYAEGGAPDADLIPGGLPPLPEPPETELDRYYARLDRLANRPPVQNALLPQSEAERRALQNDAQSFSVLMNATGMAPANRAVVAAREGRPVDAVGNAALAMMPYRPAMGLGTLGGAYTGALASDLSGAFDLPSANAQVPRAPANILPGLTPEQQTRYDQAQAALRGQPTRAERRQHEKTMEELRAISSAHSIAANNARIGSQSETDRLAREEYNRSVLGAEAGLADARHRTPRPFRETNVGRLYEETGGWTPAVMGFGTSAIARAVGRGRPEALAEGALVGAVTPNAPLVWDMLSQPTLNPERTMYSNYARDLPPTHPRRQEWTDYANRLPEENPARRLASGEFYNPLRALERTGMGGLEGLVGAFPGANLAEGGRWLSGNIGNGLGRMFGRRQGMPPEQTPLPGVIVEPPSLPPSTMARLPAPAAIPAGQSLVPGGLSSLPAPSDAPQVLTRVRDSRGRVNHHDDAGRFASNPRRQPSRNRKKDDSPEDGHKDGGLVNRALELARKFGGRAKKGYADGGAPSANPYGEPRFPNMDPRAYFQPPDPNAGSGLGHFLEQALRYAPLGMGSRVGARAMGPTQAELAEAYRVLGEHTPQPRPPIPRMTNEEAMRWFDSQGLSGASDLIRKYTPNAMPLDPRADAMLRFNSMQPPPRSRMHANGGHVSEGSGPVVAGPILGTDGGRDDAKPVSVKSGSFVIPSHVVSGLPGAGSNTLSGMRMLEQFFGKPSPHAMASGGPASDIPIKISSGEFVVTPEQVARIGGGDMEKGHRVLDAFCVQVQRQHAKEVAKLPRPATD